MESLELIKDSLIYATFLTTLVGGLAAVLALPAGAAVSYALGREHEFGFKDGKSAVKCMWKVARNVDIRDLFGKRKFGDEEFNEKYKHLGLENYFIKDLNP